MESLSVILDMGVLHLMMQDFFIDKIEAYMRKKWDLNIRKK